MPFGVGEWRRRGVNMRSIRVLDELRTSTPEISRHTTIIFISAPAHHAATTIILIACDGLNVVPEQRMDFMHRSAPTLRRFVQIHRTVRHRQCDRQASMGTVSSSLLLTPAQRHRSSAFRRMLRRLSLWRPMTAFPLN